MGEGCVMPTDRAIENAVASVKIEANQNKNILYEKLYEKCRIKVWKNIK